MQLTNNQTKKLSYSYIYNTAKAGEVTLFETNTNLSPKQQEFFIKKLILCWNKHDSLIQQRNDLLKACKWLTKAYEGMLANSGLRASDSKKIPGLVNAKQAIAKA